MKTTLNVIADRKYMFQLVDAENGMRSDVVVCSHSELARMLEDSESSYEDDLVLLLCDSEFNSDDWGGFAKAPLVTVAHFVELFSKKEVA